MATKIRLDSGLYITMLTDVERERAWKELDIDVRYKPTDAQFTPQDNLKYFVLSEIELSYDHWLTVLKANNKEIKVKHGICNQHEKTYKAVRNAYK